MRAKELRDLSDQELATREHELRETQFRFRLRRGTNQLESPAALCENGSAGDRASPALNRRT